MIKPRTPQIPPQLEPGSIAALGDDDTIENSLIIQADFSTNKAASVSLDEVILRKTLFIGARLDKLVAQDTKLENCDFSAAQCSEISLLRTEVTAGRMTGWDVNKGLFKDVTFKGCKLDMANFRFAKLQNVVFNDCLLNSADFLHAELTNVSFISCSLEKADFNQSKLHNVDLRTSQLDSLRGWRYLSGATIDSLQLTQIAPYLANELGLKVEDL